MGFLDGLFETKRVSASELQAGAIARATGGSISGMAGTYAAPGNWDVEKSVRQGYERVMFVFRCVDAIAATQSSIPIVVRRGNIRDGQIIEYRDLNRLLNRRANSYEDSWQFRYRLSSQLLLSRRGAFIEVIPSKSGGIAELHLLPPGQVEPIPGIAPRPGSEERQQFVSGYKVTRSDHWIEELEPNRVIWLRSKPHPTDPYLQMTPLMAAGLAVDTDWLARMFNRNFLANDGRPGMLVAIQGQLNHDDAAEMKRRFGGGYSTAGQTSVIEADGISVQDMAASPRDLQWSELIDSSKQDIMLAFGVPESAMGNASGRTYDNADAEMEMFWTLTMIQHCDSITRPLDILTASDQDEDLVTHDYSKVDVLQRQERNRREAVSSDFAAGIATLDDVLEEYGKDRLDIPASRVYYHPSRIIIAKDEKDSEAVSKLPTLPAPAQPNAPMIPGQGMPPTGDLNQPTASDSARQGALAGTQAGQRSFENIIAARALRLSKQNPRQQAEAKDAKTAPYEERASVLEGYVEGALSAWSDRQSDVVLDRMMHTKVRKGTRHWKGENTSGTKALDPSYIVDMKQWSTDIRNTLEPRLLKAAAAEARAAATDLKTKGLIDALHRDGKGYPSGSSPLSKVIGPVSGNPIIEDVVDSALDMIETAAANQSDRVIAKIRKMDADGASFSDIKSEVQRMMSTRSPWMKALAQNATGAVIEGARSAIYGQAGKYVTKTWRSHHDERTRHTHVKANGQERRSGTPFRVGSSRLQFPRDPSGAIEETANCRCWTDWQAASPARSRAVAGMAV